MKFNYDKLQESKVRNERLCNQLANRHTREYQKREIPRGGKRKYQLPDFMIKSE